MYRAGLKIVFIFVESYEWKFIKCFGRKMKILKIHYKSLSKANVTFPYTRLIYNITAEHFKLNFSRLKRSTTYQKVAKAYKHSPIPVDVFSIWFFISKREFSSTKRTLPNTPAMNNVVFCFMNMDLNFKSPRTKCHNVLHSFAYYSAEKKLIKKDINASHRTFSGRFVNHIKLTEKTDKKT